MKKVISMQDISCVGKCSNTVALPILSAMNIETVILPTALLSTHTMFKDAVICDLTNQIEPILSHFQSEQFLFDGIYVGYLGSDKQIDIAHQLFRSYSNSLKVLDPCMADHGKLYRGFDEKYVETMKNLCCDADIIIPNITEACLLTDTPYQENYDMSYIEELLEKCVQLGSDITIITGVMKDGEIGACAHFAKENRTYMYTCKNQPQSFHGTGDIWGAVFFGALLQKKSYKDAIELACTFVSKSIAATLAEENHNEYGTNFESQLHLLTDRFHSEK